MGQNHDAFEEVAIADSTISADPALGASAQ